jgi:uncharacterized RDD family membrane protein YckC
MVMTSENRNVQMMKDCCRWNRNALPKPDFEAHGTGLARRGLTLNNRKAGRDWCTLLLFILISLSLFPRGLPAQPAPEAQPPVEAPAPEGEPQPTPPVSPEVQKELMDDTNKTAVANPEQELPDAWPRRGRGGGAWGSPMVVIGRDAVLPAGESVEAFVVIGGNGKVYGRVRQAAVVIGGDLSLYGQVGDSAVAILGNIAAHSGARVRNEAVSVGGRITVAEGAQVRRPQNVQLPDLTWLRGWFVQCVLLMRPLSLKVSWVWVIAGAFLLLYLLIASLFPRPVRACVDELTAKPATTFCLGVLTLFLLPLVIFILGVTGVGLVVVPFVLAGMFFGVLIGRVAVLEWVGWRLAHTFGAENRNTPLIGLLLGALLIAILYLVPFLGLVTFAIVTLWSLGGAVTAAFGGLRREMPESKSRTPAAAPAVAAAATSFQATAPAFAPSGPAPGASGAPAFTPEPPAASAPPAPEPPVVPDSLLYPKAALWERLAAGFLDLILVGILCVVLHPIAPIVALAYFSALWAWKNTTIGGIVVGLKVVRTDGRPLTFPVALVRSLAAAFSIMVLFLGYLWIGWDAEKQGWHDKIAGTYVLKLPRGTPLL